MKVFISIPFNGRSDDKVAGEKEAVFKRNKAVQKEPVELIDSYISENAPVSGERAGAWYLGESIKRLAESDAAVFAPGWEVARGCRIEHAVCEEYGIPILGETDTA